jgi:hypothetical protein
MQRVTFVRVNKAGIKWVALVADGGVRLETVVCTNDEDPPDSRWWLDEHGCYMCSCRKAPCGHSKDAIAEADR